RIVLMISSTSIRQPTLRRKLRRYALVLFNLRAGGPLRRMIFKWTRKSAPRRPRAGCRPTLRKPNAAASLGTAAPRQRETSGASGAAQEFDFLQRQRP